MPVRGSLKRNVGMKNKFIASLASIGVLLSALVFFNIMSTNSDAASLPRDCDNNSIIYCGATTPDELKKFYKTNKTGDLPTLYSHYGISGSMINGVSSDNLGEVHKDGRITLKGKVVATGAKSIGRQDVYKPSSPVKIGGKTYYEHEPKSTFAVESIKAWIFLDNDGKFIGAILTSCGNPVRGNPTPVPSFSCDALAASKLSREEYQFNAKGSAKNGATITGYTFDFGDGKTQDSSTASVKHTYAKAGTYTAKVTINVKVDGKTKTATSAKCTVPVTVAPAPTYSCDALTAGKITFNKYNLVAKASAANGATITGYTFDFGDGKTQNSATNTAQHTYEKAGSYTAKVSVTVKVDGQTKTVTGDKCQVTVKVDQPTYKCDALNVRTLSQTDRTYAYDLSYTVTNGATLKSVDYNFGDGQTKTGVTPEGAKNVTHTYAAAGTYKTVATLHFTVEGATKDVNCEASVTTSPDMCPLIPSIPKNDERCAPCQVPGKENLPKDSPDCYEHCIVPGKEQLPKDSPDCYENCTVPGKEHLPANSPDCKENCTVPGKEDLPKNSPDCVETPSTPETPQTPTELPKTGATDFIFGGLGVSALVAAGYYFVASRRSLANMLGR